MSARRRAREFALQALYAADVSGPTGGIAPGTGQKALKGLWSAQVAQVQEPALVEPVTPEEAQFSLELVRGVEDQASALDARIQAASTNWRLARMPVVDRNILRLGAQELLTSRDTPAAVIINEGIELAKRYGTAESRAFVNGLLDRIASETGRGGRRAR